MYGEEGSRRWVGGGEWSAGETPGACGDRQAPCLEAAQRQGSRCEIERDGEGDDGDCRGEVGGACGETASGDGGENPFAASRD